VGFRGEGRVGERVEDGKEVEEGRQNVQDVSPPGFWARAAGARVGRRRMDTSIDLRLCEFSC
jgi:hypothetical protein